MVATLHHDTTKSATTSLVRTYKSKIVASIRDVAVHEHIKLCAAAKFLLDTPEVQRLRRVRQLGSCHLVYPTAEHSRFVHCLGTAHLARKVAKKLRKNSEPDENITDCDIDLCQVAGLLHDIGHGPNSHIFDIEYIPMMRPGINYSHEHMSDAIIKERFQDNCDYKKNDILIDLFGDTETEWNRNWAFVREAISGIKLGPNNTYLGRPDKPYLYSIISDKQQGLDVDRMDYILRDMYMTGVQSDFGKADMSRLIGTAKIVEWKSMETRRKVIAYQFKSVRNPVLGKSRAKLHSDVYQHKTVFAIYNLLLSAWKSAEDSDSDDFKFYSEKLGRKVPLSHTIDDVGAFMRTDDSIDSLIRNSTDPKLSDAKSLLDRINRRQLPKRIAWLNLNKSTLSQRQLTNELIECMRVIDTKLADHSRQYLIIKIAHFHCGMGHADPATFAMYYHRGQPTVGDRIDRNQLSSIQSPMLPEHSEVHIFIDSWLPGYNDDIKQLLCRSVMEIVRMSNELRIIELDTCQSHIDSLSYIGPSVKRFRSQ